MIIGQTLLGSGSDYFSPWFPRQADAANFSAQIVAIGGTGTLTVVVQTKNTTDVDPGTNIANGTFTGTAAGVISTSSTVTGLKELVRFKYNVNNLAGAFAHFRVLPPAWQAN